jgi:hypothetical protein
MALNIEQKTFIYIHPLASHLCVGTIRDQAKFMGIRGPGRINFDTSRKLLCPVVF